MNDLEKKDRYNRLMFLYGSLLTAKKLGKIEDYFAQDYSISEIAERDSISRNAVHLAIKDAIDELEYYESKLHLLERRERIEEILLEMEKNSSSSELVDKLRKEIDYGI